MSARMNAPAAVGNPAGAETFEVLELTGAPIGLVAPVALSNACHATS